MPARIDMTMYALVKDMLLCSLKQGTVQGAGGHSWKSSMYLGLGNTKSRYDPETGCYRAPCAGFGRGAQRTLFEKKSGIKYVSTPQLCCSIVRCRHTFSGYDVV